MSTYYLDDGYAVQYFIQNASSSFFDYWYAYSSFDDLQKSSNQNLFEFIIFIGLMPSARHKYYFE